MSPQRRIIGLISQDGITSVAFARPARLCRQEPGYLSLDSGVRMSKRSNVAAHLLHALLDGGVEVRSRGRSLQRIDNPGHQDGHELQESSLELEVLQLLCHFAVQEAEFDQCHLRSHESKVNALAEGDSGEPWELRLVQEPNARKA